MLQLLEKPTERLSRLRVPSREALILTGLYLLAVGACALLVAPDQQVPQLFPDEYVYGGLAQSFAAGDGLMFRGAESPVRHVLYPILVSIAWALDDGNGGYALAKVLNAALMSLTALPVWLLARRLTNDARLALVPAALVLAGSWIGMTARISTESLALPLSTAALASMVVALRTPGRLWTIASLGLMALASFARIQLVALVPVFLLALLLDVAVRRRGERRSRARELREPLAATGVLVLAGALALVASSDSALGTYAIVADSRPSVSEVLTWAGYHGVALVVLCGFVPAAVAIALAADGKNWRDPDAGPVLAVLAASVAVFLLMTGWFIASIPEWLIERYVFYLAPLALVALVLVPGRVSSRSGWIGVGATALLLLALPIVELRVEGRAVYAWRELGADIFSERPRVAVLLLGTALAGAGVALLTRRISVPRLSPVAAAGALTLLVLLWTTARTVTGDEAFAKAERDLLPADIEWVGHATGGRQVALLQLEHHELNYANYNTEFFNPGISTVYRLPGVVVEYVGRTCEVRIAADGTLRGQAPCGPVSPRVLLERSVQRARLHDEVRRTPSAIAGTLVVTRGAPRLLSLVSPPCNPRGNRCSTVLRTKLWLDEPARLRIRFRGGAEDNFAIAATGEEFDIPAGGESEFELPVRAGRSEVRLQTSWLTPRGSPELVAVELVERERATALW